LLATIAVIVSLWLLISHFTAVVSISISDTDISKTIDKSKYEKVIQDYFGINPLSRFQFLMNQSELITYVSGKLPEVKTVIQKSMVGIGVTDFTMLMRKPVAGWKINDKQYYVDDSGVAFEQNHFITPEVQVIDNSGASFQAGEASVSKRFLAFVGLVVALAKTSGYTVTQAILPSNTTRELDIKLKDNDLIVKMSIDRSAGEQVEDMSRVIKYLVGRQMPGYIDVRVSGEAFYK
jgi:hypothetical protein